MPRDYIDFKYFCEKLIELTSEEMKEINTCDLAILISNFMTITPFCSNFKQTKFFLQETTDEIISRINAKQLSDKQIIYLLQKLKEPKSFIFFYRWIDSMSELIKKILEEIVFKKINDPLYNYKDFNYFIIILNLMNSYNIYDQNILAKLETIISFLLDNGTPGIDKGAIMAYDFSLKLGDGKGEFLTLKKK